VTASLPGEAAGKPRRLQLGKIEKNRPARRLAMRNEFTAVIEKDGQWYIAYCPEIPGANGQGKTKEECRASLAEAIRMILDERRKDALRGVPRSAIKGTVALS
jgi:predicted RNase H-like HicB family nuclease